MEESIDKIVADLKQHLKECMIVDCDICEIIRGYWKNMQVTHWVMTQNSGI